MIKKGNLLRSEKPLDTERVPVTPWKSNLIPQSMSKLGQPVLNTNSHVPVRKNLEVVQERGPQSDSDLGCEMTPQKDDIIQKSNSSEVPIDLDIDGEFNDRWIRWKGFFKTLKRKLLENLSDAPVRFRELNDSFYSQALLYSLHTSEDSQRHIRKYGSGTYSQFLDSNKDLMSAFYGNKMRGRKQAYQFLQKILIALCICEILEVHSPVLKLEGSAAAGLCPDKKDFIGKHLQRVWGDLFSDQEESIKGFQNFLMKEIPTDLVQSVTFNRETVKVEVNLKLHSTENKFVIKGSSDRIEELEVTLLS